MRGIRHEAQHRNWYRYLLYGTGTRYYAGPVYLDRGGKGWLHDSGSLGWQPISSSRSTNRSIYDRHKLLQHIMRLEVIFTMENCFVHFSA